MLGVPCSLFLTELQLGVSVLSGPDINMDVMVLYKSPVWSRGKHNGLEFGRHEFHPRIQANVSLEKQFTHPGPCILFI